MSDDNDDVNHEERPVDNFNPERWQFIKDELNREKSEQLHKGSGFYFFRQTVKICETKLKKREGFDDIIYLMANLYR